MPSTTAAEATSVLTRWDVPGSPLLDAGHFSAFLVLPSMADGRDIPGGVLLTGVAGEVVRCPRPDHAAGGTRLWTVAPDGSAHLLDPWTLADALHAVRVMRSDGPDSLTSGEASC
ncbi:hypothetical protein ACIBEA_39690 [Streptomyces sp. NPDC051555]|uniref:hypothetical protein n=1 Tax=Streptomyces sp. NPDC051555 TaxID=3365657 RepID=UPI003789D062